jgi:peroxiredoxin
MTFNTKFMLSLLLFCNTLAASLVLAEAPKTVSAPNTATKSELKFDESALKIELDDIAGKKFSIANEKRPTIVMVFLGLECPVANTYVSEIRGLQEKYRNENDKIAWIGIHSEVGVTREAAKKHASEYKIELPIVLDANQKVAHGLSAKVLGQVIVLKDKKVIYRGRIDDRFAANGKRRDKASTHELADVLDAVLAGKEPPISETAAYGCPIPSPTAKK